MSSNANPVPVFIPSLCSILLAMEDKKGEPLTESEVLKLRYQASCIMMEPDDATQLAESRGYEDIDPENCWYDFQQLRRSLGRKPDLDAGARVQQVRNDDPEMARAVEQARATLDDLRKFLRTPPFGFARPMLKTLVMDGDTRVFLWMIATEVTAAGFECELFEVPTSITSYRPGDKLQVRSDEVVDWMVNVFGTLRGGFSLRVHRARLPESQRESFDRQIGVKAYA